jgi:hypothetical protein
MPSSKPGRLLTSKSGELRLSETGANNHQGLGNRLIQPDRDHLTNTGAVQRREHLGGMLNYYYRTAA